MKTELEPRLSKRPTQHDVARMAGVSRVTVSYVVNGLANGKVQISPETQARVWKAIESLGYVPDAGARSLRSGATHTVGLIIPDTRNPHFWQHANGVEQALRSAGYRMLLASMDLNAAYGEESFQDLAGRRLDALILAGCLVDQSEAVRQITSHGTRRGMPLVEIRDYRASESLTDQVIADYRKAAAEAMAHLIALGHKRIGIVYAVAQVELGLDRLEPYREALASSGLPADPALEVHCGAAIEDGYAAARQLLALSDPPTAIVAINDVMAIATMRAAGDCGLRVPEDVSVVGFDDIPEASYLVPRLTTATKDAVGMGRIAVNMVLARIQEPTLPLQMVIAPTAFLVRESTARAREP